MAAEGVSLRAARLADRSAVEDVCRGVWEGHDYLPSVFDRWLADPQSIFQVGELDGQVVAVHRLRPIAPGLVFYEGLRVAAAHRRRGIARAMLLSALESARDQGFAEMRLVTAGDHLAAPLVESNGFELICTTQVWTASGLEGGDLPRMVSDDSAAALWPTLAADPALAAYRGVNPDWQAVLDLDLPLLRRLAGEGLLRQSGPPWAIAILHEPVEDRLSVTFAAGSDAALEELLTGLRYEADARNLQSVTLVAPLDHPSTESVRGVGYHLADDSWSMRAYRLKL
ncbi:MAG: GNAT family N-acetyltransferase [Acidimicrobiales bacterium]